MRLMNSIKNAVRSINSNKNKLNSEIIFIYNLNPNGGLNNTSFSHTPLTNVGEM